MLDCSRHVLELLLLLGGTLLLLGSLSSAHRVESPHLIGYLSLLGRRGKLVILLVDELYYFLDLVLDVVARVTVLILLGLNKLKLGLRLCSLV